MKYTNFLVTRRVDTHTPLWINLLIIFYLTLKTAFKNLLIIFQKFLKWLIILLINLTCLREVFQSRINPSLNFNLYQRLLFLLKSFPPFTFFFCYLFHGYFLYLSILFFVQFYSPTSMIQINYIVWHIVNIYLFLYRLFLIF